MRGRKNTPGWVPQPTLSGSLHGGFWDHKRRKQDWVERGDSCYADSVNTSTDPMKSSKFTTASALSGKARSLLLGQIRSDQVESRPMDDTYLQRGKNTCDAHLSLKVPKQ